MMTQLQSSHGTVGYIIISAPNFSQAMYQGIAACIALHYFFFFNFFATFSLNRVKVTKNNKRSDAIYVKVRIYAHLNS